MPVLESLVVVDRETRSRDALTFAFERRGAAVHATSDPREALALADTRVPQLLVVSATAQLDARQLVLALRASKKSLDIPALVLGESAAGEALRAAGASDFMARPVFLRDVVTLGRLLASRENDAETAELSDDGGLFCLARALHFARRTGVLTASDRGRSGELHLRNGVLIGARVGQLSGANAFHQLLLWDAGHATLRASEPSDLGRPIHKPMDRLLDDGQRFVVQFEEIASRVGGARALYHKDLRRLEEVKREVPAELMPLVELFDGKRTVAEVVEESTFKPFDTLMIIHRLHELGAIGTGEARTVKRAVKGWLRPTAPPAPPHVEGEVGRLIAEMADAHLEGPAPRDATVRFERPPAEETPAPTPPKLATKLPPKLDERPLPAKPKREEKPIVAKAPAVVIAPTPSPEIEPPPPLVVREERRPSSKQKSSEVTTVYKRKVDAPPPAPAVVHPPLPPAQAFAEPAPHESARFKKASASKGAERPSQPPVVRAPPPPIPSVAMEPPAVKVEPIVPRESLAPIAEPEPPPVVVAPKPTLEIVPDEELVHEGPELSAVIEAALAPPVVEARPESGRRRKPSSHRREPTSRQRREVAPEAKVIIDESLAEAPRPPRKETARTKRSTDPTRKIEAALIEPTPAAPEREPTPHSRRGRASSPSLVTVPREITVPRAKPIAAPPPQGREPTGARGKVGFDALDEEFFAREAELQKVEAVDNFDDLGEAPGDDDEGGGWFGKPSRRKR